MKNSFPDLELYILKPTYDEIEDWLTHHFSSQMVSRSDENSQRCCWEISIAQQVMQVQLTLAVEKQFASLWFKTNHTPWPTDLEAAKALYHQLAKEVRCSDSGWQDGEEETGSSGWIKINQRGEQTFQWF